MSKHLLLVFALVSAVSLPAAEGPQVFAIRNARIVPVSGPPIDKGTVVVRDGLIEAVGASVTPPSDAWIVNGEGLTVYPGLIDALSTWGLPAPITLTTTSSRSATTSTASITSASVTTPAAPVTVIRGPEDRPSNSSYRKAADEIVPTDRSIEAARDAGFTTAITYPTTNIFAGQGVIFDLAGDRAGSMIVNPSAGMYLSMSTGTPRTAGGGAPRQFPGALFGVIAYIRQIYLDADHYKLANEIYAKHPQGLQRPPYDRYLEAVLESPRILLPASRAVEVERMVHLGQELKRSTLIYGGAEAWRAADILKQTDTPVLVSLKWPERPLTADPDNPDSLRILEMRDNAPSTPAALAKSGVKFAFYSDGIPVPRDVVRAVKKAIDAGLAPADAVRAMTLSAAEIYHVADRVGSIDKGKIANLLVTDGELFQDRTRVKYVFVDGIKYETSPERPQ